MLGGLSNISFWKPIYALIFVAALLAPGFANAQESNEVPRFICSVGPANRECTRSNPADTENNLPPSETRCTFNPTGEYAEDFLEGQKVCTTTFQGGTTQTCTQNQNGFGGTGPWRCVGTVPTTGETYTSESPNIVGSVTGAAADTANTLVVKPIIMFLLTLAGWVLGVAGVFFNWVVIKTVFEFGRYFGTTDSMLIAWGVVRDIANIGLLFGFIFMGVLLMLNVDGGGHGHGGGISARKAIPRLILFAVLLNFSLFASQAIIDISNGFASTFASLAGEQCDSEATANACANDGIAGKVLQLAGIGTLWDEGIIEGFNTSTVTLAGLTIFVVITAIVLLAAGIMLIIRVVTLTLLMVTSPIGFAGMVIPGLEGIAKKWWDTLLSQSFFAPLMLLMVFLSLKIADSLNPGRTPLVKAFSEANYSVAGNLEVLVVFAVVIGMMIASLIVSSKFGAVGASVATNSASALVFGSMARGTNLAVGGGARGLRAIQQRTGLGGRAGEVVVNRALRPLEKTNFDLRRLPGASAGLGVAGISAGAKAAEHATYGDMAHQVDDLRSGKGGARLHEEYEAERLTSKLERNAHNDKMDPEDLRHLSSMSTKQLEQMHGIKEGVEALAQNLSPEQFDALMKSDKLSDIEKGKLKTGRFAALTKAVADANKAPDQASKAAAENEVKRLLGSLGKSDLENIPATLLAESTVLGKLSDKQRDTLSESNKRTASEKQAVKGSYAHEQINAAFKASSDPSAAAVEAARNLSNLTIPQVAKLDAAILTRPEVAASLTPAMLAKLQDENKLTAEQMATIGANIRGGSVNEQMQNYLSGPAGAIW